jgi:hypothetical protein
MKNAIANSKSTRLQELTEAEMATVQGGGGFSVSRVHPLDKLGPFLGGPIRPWVPLPPYTHPFMK